MNVNSGPWELMERVGASLFHGMHCIRMTSRGSELRLEICESRDGMERNGNKMQFTIEGRVYSEKNKGTLDLLHLAIRLILRRSIV